MINIYTKNIEFVDVVFDFQSFLVMMSDNFIDNDTYIHFKFSDGKRGSVKKSCITGFSEPNDEEAPC